MMEPQNKNHSPPPQPLRTLEEVTQLLKPSSNGGGGGDSSSSCSTKVVSAHHLDELKLCWREPRRKHDSVGLLNKRNIAALEKALKKTPSRIARLSIGWKHGGNRKSLIRLLQVFIPTDNATTTTNSTTSSIRSTTSTSSGSSSSTTTGSTPAAAAPAAAPTILPSSIASLESIELVLCAWIPDTVLLQLLQLHAPRLRQIRVQSTRMKVRTPVKTTFKNVYQSIHNIEYELQEESVAQLLANPTLASSLTSLTSLSLVDCDVLDDQVDIVVRFLWHHYSRSRRRQQDQQQDQQQEQPQPLALESLSLRSNRHMSPLSLQKLCQAPVSKSLDLSLCDITNAGALAMAQAFTMTTNNNTSSSKNWRHQHNVTLKEFVVSGNYQIDDIGFAALARVIPCQVLHWNMSYCDMNEHQTMAILDELNRQLVVLSSTAATKTTTTTTTATGGAESTTSINTTDATPPQVVPVLLPCRLQELILQGAKINNANACQTIRSILQNCCCSLIKFCLNDPHYTNPITAVPNLQWIVEGLEINYALQELQVDLPRYCYGSPPLRYHNQDNHNNSNNHNDTDNQCHDRSSRRSPHHPSSSSSSPQEQARKVHDEMEFYLLLNRAGRKILQRDEQLDKEAWIQVLLQGRFVSSGRLDVFYWLVRNSVDHLF